MAFRERHGPLRRRLGRAARPRPGPAPALRLLGAGRARRRHGRNGPEVARRPPAPGRLSSGPSPAKPAPITPSSTASRTSSTRSSPRDRRGSHRHARRPARAEPAVQAACEIADEGTLRCVHRDGSEPFVLHQFVRKPWLEPMYHGIYSRLLLRLLLADDVAIAVGADAVPLRMRPGARARPSAPPSTSSTSAAGTRRTPAAPAPGGVRLPLEAPTKARAVDAPGRLLLRRRASATSRARSRWSTRCACSATPSRSSCSTAASATRSASSSPARRRSSRRRPSDAAMAARRRSLRSPPGARRWS